MTTNSNFCQIGKDVVNVELAAIKKLLTRIDNSFALACEILLACKGRIIVTGMGKSGHIANKIAATFASTGSPASFMHPAEASHGDIGVITQQDVMVALSNSGTTEEILTLLPSIKRLGIKLITLTGNANSVLAKEADVNLDVSAEKEACPLNLAPTASTTTALVMGDALAIALLEAKGFTREDFAFSHPAGRLGRRLLLRIKDIMHVGEAIPKVLQTASLSAALLEMTQKRLGMTAIVDEHDQLKGVFTDGDLRRALNNDVNVHHTPISALMVRDCITVTADMLAVEALKIFESRNINALLVVDGQNKLIGALNFLDLLKAGVV